MTPFMRGADFVAHAWRGRRSWLQLAAVASPARWRAWTMASAKLAVGGLKGEGGTEEVFSGEAAADLDAGDHEAEHGGGADVGPEQEDALVDIRLEEGPRAEGGAGGGDDGEGQDAAGSAGGAEAEGGPDGEEKRNENEREVAARRDSRGEKR